MCKFIFSRAFNFSKQNKKSVVGRLILSEVVVVGYLEGSPRGHEVRMEPSRMPRSLASGEGEEGHPGMREQQSRGSEVCAGQGVGPCWLQGVQVLSWMRGGGMGAFWGEKGFQ